MPTGYTAAVQTGEITDFSNFALQCARAMGALIMMRDKPSDVPIPDRFEPEVSYYDSKLAEASARLAQLRGMSPLEVREAAQQAYAVDIRAEANYVERKDADRQRYEAMLLKVADWVPPTQDHIGLKEFMVEQLESSIRFDCPEGGYWYPPTKLEPDAWLAGQIGAAEREIERQTAERAKEVERTEGRNRWLAILLPSLLPA